MLPNGIYTIQNQAGGHRTFSIRTQPTDARFATGARIAALLKGPDNEQDYQGFAFVAEPGAPLRVWNKKRGSPGQPSVFEHYARLLALVDVPDGAEEDRRTTIRLGERAYQVLCSVRCLVCNRRLTTPESIRAGIGPICSRRKTGAA